MGVNFQSSCNLANLEVSEVPSDEHSWPNVAKFEAMSQMIVCCQHVVVFEDGVFSKAWSCRKNKILRWVIPSFIIPTFWFFLPPKSCWEEPKIGANFCKDVNGRHLDFSTCPAMAPSRFRIFINDFQTKVSPRIDFVESLLWLTIKYFLGCDLFYER